MLLINRGGSIGVYGVSGIARLNRPRICNGLYIELYVDVIHPQIMQQYQQLLAEGVGFEPTVPLQARRFSRPVP